MRTFRGICSNISRPIVGKIVSEISSLHSKEPDSFVLVFHDSTSGELRSAMVLEKYAQLHNVGDEPRFRLSDKDTPFAVGDILLLEPSGTGTVLFEKHSPSNALMLTERCNCRCITCPQPPQDKQNEADLVDLSLKIISLADASTELLGITGGEPTLAWDGLMRVLAACREHLPATSLQLLTNARVLKDYQKAKELASAGNGSLMVCVPLYADVNNLHDEIVASKGAFWDTLEALLNLARVGIPVELRTVIIQANWRRLANWAEFVYRNTPFVVHVALMGLEPIGLAAQNIDRIWIDPLDYHTELKAAVRVLHRRGLAVSIYNHQLCTLPEDLWAFSRNSISGWKNVYMEQCDLCSEKSACGGFFYSSRTRRSRGINAFRVSPDHKILGIGAGQGKECYQWLDG